jgi:hypothetical protein
MEGGTDWEREIERKLRVCDICDICDNRFCLQARNWPANNSDGVCGALGEV